MKAIRFIILSFCSLLMFSSCQNTNKCLQKYGYQDCEHLKQALNLQDNDEAIKYHNIKKKCGCKE